MDKNPLVQSTSEEVILQQNWWHIEDSIEPSEGRLVFKVQDFFKDIVELKQNNYISIKMPLYFVGFKVRNKNSGQELSFIENYEEDDKGIETNLKVNLGESSDWPKVKNSNNVHVKIEYEYIDFWPKFNRRATVPLGVKKPDPDNNKNFEIEPYDPDLSSFEKLKFRFWPGYNGQFKIEGPSQGEISILVPLGMKLYKEGKETEIILFKGPVKPNTKKVYLGYHKPHVSSYKNKLKYHYIIGNKSYKEIKKTLKDKIDMNLIIEYNVVHEPKFYLIPSFSALIIVVVAIVNWSAENLFYFAVLLLSFSTLYLSLRKEKFQIPLNRFVFVSIILDIGIVMVKFVIKYHVQILSYI